MCNLIEITMNQARHRMHRPCFIVASTVICGLLTLNQIFTAATASAADLFSEDFEGLTLKPVVTFDSEIRSREAWTDIPPAGWTVDNSGVATANDPNSGVFEFEGWRFLDKDWWISTSGDQARSKFASARGIVAVADPDEWDDFPAVSGLPSPDDQGGCDPDNLSSCFSAKLKTPAISLAGVGANQAKAFFHSSWRDEDDQKASLKAIYDNGTTLDLLPLAQGGVGHWESEKTVSDGMGGTVPNPYFKDDAVNEGLTVDLMNPAGATSVQLEFRVYDARNDWWWAIDNLQVFTGAAPAADGVLRATIDRGTGAVKIVNNTGSAVNLRGYSIVSSAGTFDEAGAAFLSDADPNWLQATQLGDASNDLSEIHLTSDVLSNQEQIAFGNVWVKFYRDIGADIESTPDVSFEYLTAESDEPVQGIVEFTGNGGNSYQFLDLNYSGAIEIGDWLAFKAGFGVSLTGRTEAQALQSRRLGQRRAAHRARFHRLCQWVRRRLGKRVVCPGFGRRSRAEFYSARLLRCRTCWRNEATKPNLPSAAAHRGVCCAGRRDRVVRCARSTCIIQRKLREPDPGAKSRRNTCRLQCLDQHATDGLDDRQQRNSWHWESHDRRREGMGRLVVPQ